MQFKTDRIRDEYEELKTRNPKLRSTLECADLYTRTEFNKEIVLTCIYRSPDENKALYAPNPEPATQPHTKWDAADLRSTIFTQGEINKLLTFLNCFSYVGGQRKVATYHLIAGNTWHLHCQTR